MNEAGILVPVGGDTEGSPPTCLKDTVTRSPQQTAPKPAACPMPEADAVGGVRHRPLWPPAEATELRPPHTRRETPASPQTPGGTPQPRVQQKRCVVETDRRSQTPEECSPVPENCQGPGCDCRASHGSAVRIHLTECSPRGQEVLFVAEVEEVNET